MKLSQKYSDEYNNLRKELVEIQTRLTDQESINQRAMKFIKLVEKYCAFKEITPTVINEFISKLVVHERDSKKARQTIQHVEIHFNYIGTFENEITELAEPTEQDLERMRAEIAESQAEKRRAYHRAYGKEWRAKNLEKNREYSRNKAREYRAKKKLLSA